MPETGSVQIVLADEGDNTKKEGIEFQCIKVADIINGEYSFLDNIVLRKTVELEQEMTAEQMDDIARLLAEQEYDTKSEVTDSKGEITFDNLAAGLYLLKAKESKSYGVISPVLVAVPSWDEIEKKMEYNVKVIPKHANEISQSVKTGDSQKLTGYLGAAGVSLLCIGCWIRRRKIYDRQ